MLTGKELTDMGFTLRDHDAVLVIDPDITMIYDPRADHMTCLKGTEGMRLNCPDQYQVACAISQLRSDAQNRNGAEDDGNEQSATTD